MRTAGTPRAAAAWIVICALAAAIAWSLLPAGTGRDVLQVAITPAAALVTAACARSRIGRGQWGWVLLIMALLLLGAGDALAAARLHGSGAPGWAPGTAHLAAAALVLASVLYLARARGSVRNLGAAVDALVVGLAFYSFVWVALIEPGLANDLPVSVVAPAAATAVIMLLAAAIGTAVFVSPGVRHQAIVLLTAAMYLLFAGTALDGWHVVRGEGVHDPADVLVNALAAALVPAACAFPPWRASVRQRTGGAATLLTPYRVVLMGLVSLVPVVVLAQQAPDGVGTDDVATYGAAAGLVTLATLLRATGLLRTTRRAFAREEILRRAAVALAGAPDTAAVHRAAVDSALAFVEDVRARVSLALIDPDGEGISIVAAAGADAQDVLGMQLGPQAVAIARAAMAAPSTGLLAGDVPGVDTSIGNDPLTIFPLMVGGEGIGVISVRTTAPPDGDERASLEALAAQVALALDGRRQAEAAARSSTERHFQALVSNATDLITVVDSRLIVRFQSPSIADALGWTPDEVLGRSPVALVHAEDRRRVLLYWRGILDRPGGHPAVDFRALCKDGSWRHVETVASNLLDDEDVRGIVLTTRDVTDRRDLETRLAHQAFHDELTGLANRALFNDRVEHSLAVAEREARSTAVLFLDLDDFKEVNDSLGHQAGDALLVETARRIEACLRQGDTAARLSGDEFGILLERATRESATAVAERVLDALLRPITISGKELFLRASVGIALSPADGRSADELLRNADTAMYRAKGAGKSAFALFKQSMHTAALQRLELRSELEEAAQRGELSLRYQPIFALGSGHVAGFEALLRWTHPRRGLIQPSTFISLAEETGSIVPIGAWVFETALAQLHAWETRWPEQARDLWLSVNLSTRQLAEPGLPESLAGIVDRTGVDPARVLVEVTESVLVADADAAARRLAALRALGLRVAIDDFGTGYSSLGVLEQMPVDVLKIASRFVERLGTDEHRPRLVEALVRLGDTLNLPTVAEGIENVTQLTVLQLLGCEMGQGFYLSRPLRVDRVEGLLARAAAGDPLVVGGR